MFGLCRFNLQESDNLRFIHDDFKDMNAEFDAICREFLGIVGLHDLNNDIPELGIWTKTNSHGNHYGREAIGGLIKYAQERGNTKLIYPVDKKNIASKKIPLFYGGKVMVSNKLVTTLDGRTLDEEIYEINPRPTAAMLAAFGRRFDNGYSLFCNDHSLYTNIIWHIP